MEIWARSEADKPRIAAKSRGTKNLRWYEKNLEILENRGIDEKFENTGVACNSFISLYLIDL
jgi:hypothetical protein